VNWLSILGLPIKAIFRASLNDAPVFLPLRIGPKKFDLFKTGLTHRAYAGFVRCSMISHKLISIIILLFFGLACITTFHAEEAVKDIFICPMQCKNLEFDKEGTCPVCGMHLVKKADFIRNDTRKKAAILIFDGVQIIDYAAPYEVFGQARFYVYTVAESRQPITTSMNMTVTPAFDFHSAPVPDVLIVPGGAIESPAGSTQAMSWIKTTAQKAQLVLSVCNGAFLLAKAGLLDGLSATTFYGLLDELGQQAPKTKIVRDQRFVDNGKIVTTAGLSSGIDGSLHVLSKMLGKGEVQRIALHLEYNWQPDLGFARAALADMNLPDLQPPAGAGWKYLRTEGNRNHWELEGSLQTDLSRTELVDHLKTNLSSAANWKEVSNKKDSVTTLWSFSDRDGKPWKASVRIEESKSESNSYVVKFELQRSS
jgi:putative intracellular protease/amidase